MRRGFSGRAAIGALCDVWTAVREKSSSKSNPGFERFDPKAQEKAAREALKLKFLPEGIDHPGQLDAGARHEFEQQYKAALADLQRSTHRQRTKLDAAAEERQKQLTAKRDAQATRAKEERERVQRSRQQRRSGEHRLPSRFTSVQDYRPDEEPPQQQQPKSADAAELDADDRSPAEK